MPPMDIKDWWLAAAAATSMATPLANAATQAGEQVGVVTAIQPGVQSSAADRVIYIGNNIVFGERLKTDATGVIHILFMDQSSMTLGPNSEVIIDEFSFHPEKQQGNIAVNLVKGALRVVGGFVSKFSATKVRTTNATIGIRGGITLVEAEPEFTRGVFLFGQHMEFSPADGSQTQTVVRPGFSLTARQNTLEAPVRFSPAQMSQLLNHFEARQTTQATAPLPTPGGGLISTNDRPSALNNPGTAVAQDRVQRVSVEVDQKTPASSLRGLLGSNTTEIQS